MRYTRDELERLRESPLVVRPPNLPPSEEYIGVQNIEGYDRKAARERRESNSLMDSTNRRPNLDKAARSTNSVGDIVLGPPRTSFASATSKRNAAGGEQSDRGARDSEPPRDRYPFRKGDAENDRSRDTRGFNLRSRRPDGENDSEGWSTVKPRKSFGADGTERFTGRMGGDRNREDAPTMPRRGSKDARDDIRGDRPRGFDSYSRDKDVIRESIEENDGTARRNGYGRGRNEPSWFKDKADSAPPENRKSNGERFGDRNRGWREKQEDEKNGDRNDRNDRNDRDHRGGERDDRTRGRWDRDDRRQEREPEWMEESGGQEKRAHTAAEFQKWKESMNAGIMKTPATEEVPAKTPGLDLSGQNSFFGFDKPKVETPSAMEGGGGKFNSMWASSIDDAPLVNKNDGGLKTANIGKASRFTSFFSQPQPDDSPRRQTEPAPRPPPGKQEANPQADKEADDFSRLLLKLRDQNIGSGAKAPTPPASQSMQPRPPAPTQKPMNIQLPPLEQFQYGRPGYQPEPPRSGSQSSHNPAMHELLGSRASSMSQPSSRPDLVQDLMNQRGNTMSQGSGRGEPQSLDRSAAHLMGLLNQSRPTPDQMRPEQLMMRGPPQQQGRVPPNAQHQRMMMDEELRMRELRERELAGQRQRQDAPPAFFDDGFMGRGPMSAGPEGRGNQQPTQILQRPPPGLDQMRDQLPPHWAQQNQREQQLPPPMSQRHPIGAPPGLQNGPGGPQRGMPPVPPMGLPPGFPGQFGGPPPDMVGNGRGMPPFPPPGFMGMAPPPGFMPPPNMGGFPGGPNGPPPDMGYPPYDGRGGPPQQGPFRR